MECGQCILLAFGIFLLLLLLGYYSLDIVKISEFSATSFVNPMATNRKRCFNILIWSSSLWLVRSGYVDWALTNFKIAGVSVSKSFANNFFFGSGDYFIFRYKRKKRAFTEVLRNFFCNIPWGFDVTWTG